MVPTNFFFVYLGNHGNLLIINPKYFCQISRLAMPFRDHWPKMPNGRDFDGQHLLTLVRSGNSPFHDTWAL